MDYRQCCIECQFHFYEEDECPNCEAAQTYKDCEQEYHRQLVLLSRYIGFKVDDDMLWYMWNCSSPDYKSIIQKLAPMIYEWQMSIDLELEAEKYIPMEDQLNLFDEPLPF